MDLIQGVAACVDECAWKCLCTDLLIASLKVVPDIGQTASYIENGRLENLVALIVS